MERRNGHCVRIQFQDAAVSNAANAGSTIWTLTLKRVTGLQKKMTWSSKATCPLAHLGVVLLRTLKVRMFAHSFIQSKTSIINRSSSSIIHNSHTHILPSFLLSFLLTLLINLNLIYPSLSSSLAHFPSFAQSTFPLQFLLSF